MTRSGETVTKAQKVKLSRSVREHLIRFQHLQTADLQEYVRDRGNDPAWVALNHLREAKDELDGLYQAVRREYELS